MEIEKPKSSLQQKLELLKILRQGKIQQSQAMMKSISKTTKSNPQLYQKFLSFVSQHKKQIIQIEQQQRQSNNEKIVIVDGSDKEWETDDEIDWNSSDSEEEEKSKKKTKTFKNVSNNSNQKSKIKLNPLKEVKKMFVVETKSKKQKQEFINYCEKNRKSSKNLTKNSQPNMIKSSIIPKSSSKENSSKVCLPPIGQGKPHKDV